MLHLVLRKFKSVHYKQENMRQFPIYDTSKVRHSYLLLLHLALKIHDSMVTTTYNNMNKTESFKLMKAVSDTVFYMIHPIFIGATFREKFVSHQ